MRLPKVVSLPGFRISIKLVSQAELNVLDPEVDAWFDYNDDGARILILKTLPKKFQLLCFAHEMQHALVDYLDVLLKKGKAKVRSSK